MHNSNVEIFKTDVSSELIGDIIINKLNNNFPAYKVNFDLDDCDRILRIESEKLIDIENILKLFKEHSIEIKLIED